MEIGMELLLYFMEVGMGYIRLKLEIDRRGGPAGRLALNIGNPGAVGYDSKRQEILVPN